MRKIRAGLFETNSSSVHCMVVAPQALEKSPIRVYSDGKIHIKLLNFDEDELYLTTSEEKLAYLITQLWYQSGMNIENLKDNYEFGAIKEHICKYTGAKDIIIKKSRGYINHQMAGDYMPCDIWEYDSVIGFVFGKDVWLKQYRD